jgi:hypothetical protein
MINISDLVEITIEVPDDFLKIKETLSRIGIASYYYPDDPDEKVKKTLTQSCHILHKQGKYYIVHFKELFLLDGKESLFSQEDKARRNTICNLLAEWKLVKLVDVIKTKEPTISLNKIKVLSHKEKTDWNLATKYNIGKKRRRD